MEEDDRRFRASLFDVIERVLERMLADLNGVIGAEQQVVSPLTHIMEKGDSVEIVVELLECEDPNPRVRIGKDRILIRAEGTNICLKSIEVPPYLDTSRAKVRNLRDMLIIEIPKKR